DKTDFKTWPLDLLADYIEKKHHRYVESQIPVLNQYLAKLCRVHGERHPELLEVTEHFTKSAGELAMHMKKEELVLFPWVRKMVKAQRENEILGNPRFGTVQNPIRTMMQEHDNEGERFRQIAALSNDYTFWSADGLSETNVKVFLKTLSQKTGCCFRFLRKRSRLLEPHRRRSSVLG
ncbi:hypothetical protein LCGC14_1330670, partial [marine sediment metagenome]